MDFCYLCGKYGVTKCKECGEMVCEDCLTPYTQYNQIDYDCCYQCNDNNNESFANEKYEEDLFDKLGAEKYLKHKVKERKVQLIVNLINKHKDDKS